MADKSSVDIVISEFLEISKVPRPSHFEEQIGMYLYNWAKERSLVVELDEFGTVIIDKPASRGCENMSRVILQAHMDMVCTAEAGIRYNPKEDSIKVINDGVTLRAEGTSLGADNGIGIAICLYILQKPSRHGPLRVLFTANEEDGMASVNLDKKYLKGKYLINLDWETSGSLCNSCAGGDFFNYSHACDWEETASDSETITITFTGLSGGHSGVEINKGRANAIVSIATALEMMRQKGIFFNIADFNGGQAKNAIPAHASAIVVVNKSDISAAMDVLADFKKSFGSGFANIEHDYEFIYDRSERKRLRVLGRNTSERLISIISTVPNNVHTMSPFINGLVESSSNLGIVSVTEEKVAFTVFARSSSEYQALQIDTICKSLADTNGFELECEGHIPGWAVNPNSRLVKIASDKYTEITGDDMTVEPIHAGVECGAFVGKNPALDMISIGPEILNAHTPVESCNIDSIGTVVELLTSILEELTEY